MFLGPTPKVFILIREINISLKFKRTMFRRYSISVIHEA